MELIPLHVWEIDSFQVQRDNLQNATQFCVKVQVAAGSLQAVGVGFVVALADQEKATFPPLASFPTQSRVVNIQKSMLHKRSGVVFSRHHL